MKKIISSWIGIFVGCTILAAGFVYFINPYNLVPGGVYGASIVLHNLFPSIQVGTFGYMFDIPLLIISVLVLGAKLGARTIVAALFTPLAMNVLSLLSYPSEEALHQLDPTQLLGGSLNMSDHLMLTSVIGAVVIGIGCGIVVRSRATTGGTDIVAMILQKYCHIRFSKAILLVDGIVVGFGLLVIGFGIGNPDDATQPDHLMLTSVIGAVVIGIGCGIVVRSRATTGGTDIVAMILQKYCHIRFSKAILLVDGIVVGFGLLVIGFGIGNPDDATQPSWHLSFYSLIAIFVTSRVLAYVINGEKNDKILFVISDMRLTALHDYILKDLDRTATCIKSSGLYTNVDKEMLFLVVSYKEVVGIKQKIREVDPKAFVVVTDAYDAFGEGWKELPMAGEVQPE